jgi:hypothetical protein
MGYKMIFQPKPQKPLGFSKVCDAKTWDISRQERYNARVARDNYERAMKREHEYHHKSQAILDKIEPIAASFDEVVSAITPRQSRDD